MDNFPVDGIRLSVSPLVFAKNCSICYFCEMIFPEGAIEVDYESRARASLSRVKDIFVKVLKKAESEGRFRRLVPLEDIDWHTPYYKVYSNHPRYVIPKEDCVSGR